MRNIFKWYIIYLQLNRQNNHFTKPNDGHEFIG